MTPIQESELLLPTAEHIREAESLLCGCAMRNPLGDGAFNHADDCPAQQTMEIAQALASRDAKHALEIAVRDARIAELEAALDQIIEVGTTTVTVRIGDAYDFDDGYEDHERISDEAEIARTALKQETTE